MREYCGLPSINSFSELNNTVEEVSLKRSQRMVVLMIFLQETIRLLESVYGHHEDVDLVV